MPKNLVRRIVATVSTGLALYVVLPSLIRVIGAWPRLRTANPVWLAVAAVAETASFACTFALQRLALRTKRWFVVAGAGLAGNALTNVLPGGDAAGANLQYRMLTTAGIDPSVAAGGLTASALLGLGGLLALPILTLPAVLSGSGIKPGLVYAALLGTVGFVLFAIGAFVILATDRPLAMFGRIVQRVWNKIARRREPVVGLDQRILHERDVILSVLGRNAHKAVLLIVGRIGLDYGCLLAALRATGSNPRPSLVLLAYSAATIIALVPITPGGLGIVEASLSGMLVLAGISAPGALVATLAYRLASYWLPDAAGSVAYFVFRQRYGPIRSIGSTG